MQTGVLIKVPLNQIKSLQSPGFSVKTGTPKYKLEHVTDSAAATIFNEKDEMRYDGETSEIS